MTGFNEGINIKKLVDELPAGLERAILSVLRSHIGRPAAVSRTDLVSALIDHGFREHERAVRACINQMRKDGYPICSTGGEDGGYWLAANWDELIEFIDREVHPRAMDLLEQEQALKKRAEQTWGRYAPDHQLRMF